MLTFPINAIWALAVVCFKIGACFSLNMLRSIQPAAGFYTMLISTYVFAIFAFLSFVYRCSRAKLLIFPLFRLLLFMFFIGLLFKWHLQVECAHTNIMNDKYIVDALALFRLFEIIFVKYHWIRQWVCLPDIFSNGYQQITDDKLSCFQRTNENL